MILVRYLRLFAFKPLPRVNYLIMAHSASFSSNSREPIKKYFIVFLRKDDSLHEKFYFCERVSPK